MDAVWIIAAIAGSAFFGHITGRLMELRRSQRDLDDLIDKQDAYLASVDRWKQSTDNLIASLEQQIEAQSKLLRTMAVDR